MTAKNILTLKVQNTTHERLLLLIISKAEPRQKEFFIRDTEIKGFYLRISTKVDRPATTLLQLNIMQLAVL